MAPLNDGHCKTQAFRQGRKKKTQTDIKTRRDPKQTADRNQARPHMLPIWWNTMYSHFTPCPVQENDCQAHFSLSLSLFLHMEREREGWCRWMTASIGKAPSLICLFWPMLDLRGLISLDNKTKRVNVLIVADGAGILGKCVKLVLTSGPHSSPPCCDLLSAALYTPASLSLTPPTCTAPFLLWPCPSSLSPLIHPYRYIHVERTTGLNGKKTEKSYKLIRRSQMHMKTTSAIFGLQSI